MLLVSENEAYEDLANAIIIQAIKDYKRGNEYTKSSIKHFIYSDWFKMLTKIEPDTMIKLIENNNEPMRLQPQGKTEKR